MTDLTVVCLKWGTKYSSDYVNKLFSMVSRNLTIPFRFVCITDDANGIVDDVEIKPLLIQDDHMEGWWQKLSFFSNPLYDITGTVLTLDLDLVIVDNIDDIVNTKGDFCIVKDHLDRNGWNSSVMKFEAGQHSDILDNFDVDLVDRHSGVPGEKLTRRKYWGDQVWITECRPNATLFQEGWIISYKQFCTNHGKKKFSLPEKAKILIFHGKPDPHEVLQDIGKWWK